MDRRETMPMSGSPYYMQRNIPELHGQQQQQQGGIHQLPNPNMTSYHTTIGGGSSGSGLLSEPTHTHQSIPAEVSAGGGGGTSSLSQPTGVTLKRKRGRPRKYGSDGSVTSLALSSSPATPRTVSTSPASKRGRGRPPGSGRKLQRVASVGNNSTPPQTATGAGFTPHVINIAAGEDIAGKILSFARQGHRAVCVMSVSGAVSSVTLCQASSTGTVTYEGRFDILHMSGSFLVANNDMTRSGVLTVSLVSPDGRVIGGGVGGMLIAASPVQVILGSFVGASPKVKHKTGRGGAAGGGSDPAAIGRGEEMLDHHHHQSTENTIPAGMTLQQQQHNRGPPPTSSSIGGGGGWPGPQQAVEMQHSHFDIDLMRG